MKKVISLFIFIAFSFLLFSCYDSNATRLLPGQRKNIQTLEDGTFKSSDTVTFNMGIESKTFSELTLKFIKKRRSK